MSDPTKWIPEAYEFDERCRKLVERHEHLREPGKLLVIKVPPHIVIQHTTWLYKNGTPDEREIDELTVFYSPTHKDHTTCYESQNGRMHLLTANDRWWPAIRAAVLLLQKAMLLDDLADI